MLGLAVLLVIVGAALFAAGLFLFANGVGTAPQTRTVEDPTGLKRAVARLPWTEVFRRMPRSVGVMLDEQASRDNRLAASGSFCALVGVVLWCLAVVAFIAELV